MKNISIPAAIVLTSTLAFSFDLGNIAKGVMDNVTQSTSSTNKEKSNLNNSTVSSGLKEALKIGVDFAVKNLGKENGYLKNTLVKIPLPENLQKAEGIIRKVGGEKIADDLINSMNNAATQAAPKTTKIFLDAIDKMSLDDAKKILTGNKNAATNYFKSNTTNSLKKIITPIIQNAMKDNQVASYYDTFNNFYKTTAKDYVDNSSVMKLAKNFGVDSYLPGSSEQNLDEYVTDKAINGLFKMIAQKEAAIRTNPVAQTTSLLKQVFGK